MGGAIAGKLNFNVNEFRPRIEPITLDHPTHPNLGKLSNRIMKLNSNVLQMEEQRWIIMDEYYNVHGELNRLKRIMEDIRDRADNQHSMAAKIELKKIQSELDSLDEVSALLRTMGFL
jgi:uncharacterized coiled-coil DUF342 family protein